MPPHKEEFPTFWSQIFKKIIPLLICNVNIYFLKQNHYMHKRSWKHVVCNAIVCYDKYDEWASYDLRWDSNAMVWEFNALLWYMYLNDISCFGVCC